MNKLPSWGFSDKFSMTLAVTILIGSKNVMGTVMALRSLVEIEQRTSV